MRILAIFVPEYTEIPGCSQRAKKGRHAPALAPLRIKARARAVCSSVPFTLQPFSFLTLFPRQPIPNCVVVWACNRGYGTSSSACITLETIPQPPIQVQAIVLHGQIVESPICAGLCWLVTDGCEHKTISLLRFDQAFIVSCPSVRGSLRQSLSYRRKKVRRSNGTLAQTVCPCVTCVC